jgi:CheY-like chemotaxis protein
MHKILIADDNPEIINQITDILDRFDYELYAAVNGNSAYMVAQKSLPDLIIMDWDMPGMNGIDTLKMLKSNEQTKDILVIMITGVMNSIQNLKIAFNAGAVDFIKKPIDAVELVARTSSMLLLADSYKKSIQQKDWELTHMAKNVLKHNEHNLKILQNLKIIDENLDSDIPKCKHLVSSTINELNYNIKTQAWEQFESHFKSIHPNFVNNLLTKFPNLTPNEVKLCVFLRLNLNSKEIAEITVQISSSIDIARYRLRKKIGLDRKANLNSYLLRF